MSAITNQQEKVKLQNLQHHCRDVLAYLNFENRVMSSDGQLNLVNMTMQKMAMLQHIENLAAQLRSELPEHDLTHVARELQQLQQALRENTRLRLTLAMEGEGAACH